MADIRRAKEMMENTTSEELFENALEGYNLELRYNNRRKSLINVHAPIEEKGEEEKDLFYGRLARTIDACPGHDLIIILEDFNAKVGTEPMFR